MSEYRQSWAFTAPQRLYKLLNDPEVTTKARELQTEVTLLTSIAHVAITAPFDVCNDATNANAMRRDKTAIDRLNEWLGEKITERRLPIGQVRHSVISGQRLKDERGFTPDRWCSELKTTCLDEHQPPWTRRNLYSQMRHAMSHGMVFMKGRPAIEEIVLCPKSKAFAASEREYTELRNLLNKNSTVNSVLRESASIPDWNKLRQRVDEKEKPEIELDCLVFTHELFLATLNEWLRFFVEYGAFAGVLANGDTDTQVA